MFRRLLWMICLAALLPVSHAAESFIVVDNQTGYILASKNRDAKLPIASLTKVATTMVVLDFAQLKKGDLSALATVPAFAVETGGANPVGLQAGDQLSLRDLIYSALLASDNVAAVTLANHIGTLLPNVERLDPVGNFVAHMNALARAISMRRTLFLNPTGLDSMEGQTPYSTASDLARLVQHAYKSANGFSFYVAQRSRTIHVLRGGIDMPFEITNTNELLGTDDIDGVKTGRTRKAGDCLILSADRAPEARRDGESVFVTPRRITAVLLRSPDRFGEGLALMRQGWREYDAWAAAGRKTPASKAL